MKRLLFGCGYLGNRVAARWRERGDTVTIVTRNQEKATELRVAGYHPIVADLTKPESLVHLPSADTVLYAVGHDRSGEHSIHEVYADGLRHVLDALPSAMGRIIYISTTGVYGTAGGEWVDEDTQPAPSRDGGRASLAAEQILQEHALGKRGVILRLAGIYGPGRIPFLDLLRANEPVPVPATGYLNLIHVDDAADVVTRAAEIHIADLPRIYCVSDGQPVQRGEYYREVARILGAPAPTFVDPPPNSPRASRAASDRRVKNEQMIRELGVRLRFPSYYEGLTAILK